MDGTGPGGGNGLLPGSLRRGQEGGDKGTGYEGSGDESSEAYQNLYNSDLVEQAKTLWQEEYNTRDVAGMAYRDFRNMFCNKAINSVEDLKGVKLRLNDNQLWSESWSTLGATPVPIALGELYTSIQNGAADASEGPWEQMKSINLEEVQAIMAGQQ